jgi:hypothetical protein
MASIPFWAQGDPGESVHRERFAEYAFNASFFVPADAAA